MPYISSPIFAFASNLIFDNCGGNKSERKYIKLSNRPEKSDTNNSKQSLQPPYCKRAFLVSGFLRENGKYFVLQEEVDSWVDGGWQRWVFTTPRMLRSYENRGGRIHFVLQDEVSTVTTMCSVTLGYVHTVTFSHRFLLFGSKLEFPWDCGTIQSHAKTLPCARSLNETFGKHKRERTIRPGTPMVLTIINERSEN